MNKNYPIAGWLMLLALSTLNLQPRTAFAQGTAFTYQGQLQNNGSPANGSFNLTFALFNTNSSGVAVAGPVTNNGVIVSNGLFTVLVDFGPGAFTGATNWLEITVETNGASTFTTLTPRQQLTPAPYAIQALNANTASNLLGTLPAAQLSGTVSNSQLANSSITVTAGTGLSGGGAVALGGLTTLNNAGVLSVAGNADITASTVGGAVALGDNATSANTASTIVKRDSSGNFSAGAITGSSFSGNGASLTNVSAAALDGLKATSFWKTNGNAGANPTNGAFLGTTDNLPLEFHVNGVRALRLEPIANDMDHSNFVNVVGGSPVNSVASGVYGSVIAGGGALDYNGMTLSNSVSANLSVLGGGGGNSIQPSASWSFLGGGEGNSIQTNAATSFLGGGYKNSIQTNAEYSFLGGGWENSIQPFASYSFLGGGLDNSIQTDADNTFLGGGWDNSIQTDAGGSFLGGGGSNSIQTDATWSVLGGGLDNSIQWGASESFLGGGCSNSIQTEASESFLGGGWNNSIQAWATNCVLGGGANNTIQTNSYNSTIAGGANNTIQTDSNGATIAGGTANGVGAKADNAFVAGGYGNHANGNCAFAAGNYALVTNRNAFVWSDSTVNPTTSTKDYSVTMRASGGYYFFSSSSGGAELLPNATSWTALSDRNVKKNFQPVDVKAVLDKLAAIPIQQWNYKWEKDSDVPNIGPMAQDFKAAFYPGRDDKGISTLEFDGVELAAIQGLNQKLENEAKAKDAEIDALKQSVAELKQLLQSLAEKK